MKDQEPDPTRRDLLRLGLLAGAWLPWLDGSILLGQEQAAPLPEQLDPNRGESGLYTGVAGIGFTLHQTFKLTGNEAYRKGAGRCRDLLHAAARPAGAGDQRPVATLKAPPSGRSRTPLL